MHQILQIFKNKMTLIAYVVSKFQTVKVMVRQMSKSPNFMAHFYGQHVKRVPSTCEMSIRVLFSIYFVTLGETDLESLCVSDI